MNSSSLEAKELSRNTDNIDSISQHHQQQQSQSLSSREKRTGGIMCDLTADGSGMMETDPIMSGSNDVIDKKHSTRGRRRKSISVTNSSSVMGGMGLDANLSNTPVSTVTACASTYTGGKKGQQLQQQSLSYSGSHHHSKTVNKNTIASLLNSSVCFLFIFSLLRIIITIFF